LIERAFLVVLANGDVEESFPLAERLVGVDRGHRIARLVLAARGIKRGQFAAARNQLGLSARAPVSDLTSALVTGWALAGGGEVNAAIEAVDRFPGPDAFAWVKDFHSGLILDVAGRRKQAGERLRRAYERDKSSLRTVEAYGRWLAREAPLRPSGDGAPAAKSAASAYKGASLVEYLASIGHPTDFAARVELAQQNGIENYTGATEQNARLLRSLRESADAVAARPPDSALDIFAEFLKAMPDHPLIEAVVAEIEADRRPAPFVRNVQAGAAEVLYGIGTVLAGQGGDDLGLVYLRLALYLEPAHPLALLAIGDLHDSMQKPELAIAAYARVPEDSPLKPDTEIRRALSLNALERADEAREILERILEKRPDHTDSIVALGNVLRVAKRYEEAAAVYSKSIEVVQEPVQRHWTLFYYRAICYERAKQWPLAEQDFQKALELQPDQPDVLNYLGYSWIDMGINLDKGVDLVKRAVEQRPNSGYIVDSLGWAYYRLGRYEEAVKELERAVELRPQDSVINDHLGDAYWRVGRELEARFQWRHALDLDPEEEEIPKIDAKLKDGMPVAEPPPRAGAVEEPDKGG
jgi:tetratricopeptide (TPR) repeat protein